MNEYVAAASQLDDRVVRAAIAGVAQRAIRRVEPEGEALEERLHVLRVAHRQLPPFPLDHASGVHLVHMRRGPLPRRRAATGRVLVDAALMLNASANVRTVDAVFAEQQLGHSLDRRRTIHVEIRNLVRALVPALQHQATVVHAMVVVQVREERVSHIDGAVPGLEQPMMRARSVVHDDEIVADFDEISGALSLERRGRGSGPEERDRRRFRGGGRGDGLTRPDGLIGKDRSSRRCRNGAEKGSPLHG
jgi:hypothetical protein